MRIRLLALIFAFAVTTCKNKSDNPFAQRELYYYVNELGLKNCLEIDKGLDSLRGVFYGVELNKDSVPVYFKSSFATSKSENGNIGFGLRDFICSYKEFNFDSSGIEVIDDESKIPLMLNLEMAFLGYFNADSLLLLRLLGKHDSSGDHLTFLRMPSENKSVQ